jgi:hypothetical protein
VTLLAPKFQLPAAETQIREDRCGFIEDGLKKIKGEALIEYYVDIIIRAE